MLNVAHQPAARPVRLGCCPKGAESPPGFTLMEVLVAVTILGVGFVALFGVLSGSLRTVSRIGDRETLVRTAQMKMNRICLALRQGREPDARSGEFGGKYRWRAEIEAAGGDEKEGPRRAYRLARVRLQVAWQGSQAENRYLLETMTWVPTPLER